MSDLKIGDAAPDFTLPTDNGGSVTLSGFRGQKIVLYFYPKDDTPGCTKEACEFNEALSDFKALKAVVIGISKDTPAKHDKFKTKYNLDFPLASDEEGKVCEAYGVWKEKSLYGKTFLGIERATFLIGETGKIEQIWRKVKVPGHVEAVKEAINAPRKAA